MNGDFQGGQEKDSQSTRELRFPVFKKSSEPSEPSSPESRIAQKIKDNEDPSWKDWLGEIWNSAIRGVGGFSYNLRKNSGLADEKDYASFLEVKKNEYPDLYESYQNNLKANSRFPAQSVIYSIDDRKKLYKVGEELETFRREGVKEGGVEVAGFKVPQEKAQKIKKTLLGGTLTGLTESIPAMVLSAPTMGVAFFDMAYQGADEEIKRLEREKGLELSQSDKETYKLAIAVPSMILERVGLSGVLKNTAISKRLASLAANRVIKRVVALGEGKVTAATFNKIAREEAKGLKGFVERVGTGFLSEAETGGLQQLAADAVEQSMNMIKGKEIFDPKTAGEIAYDAIYAAVQEGIGGGIISTVVGGTSKPQMTLEEKKQVIEFVETLPDLEDVKDYIVENAKGGNIERGAAKRSYDTIKNYKEALSKIPDGLSEDNKVEALDLVLEKQKLQKQAEGLDSSIREKLIDPQIKAVEEQLVKVISNDIKTEEQVPSTEQEREATVEAQPDTEASEAAVETGRAVQLDEETQGELDDVMRDADFTVSEQETPTRTSKTDAYADEGVQGGIINLIKTKGGELGREFVGAVERIKSTLGEGYKVVVLDEARYRDVTNTTGRGAYDTKNKVLYLNAQQVRNLDKDNVRAVYHEAIHPILTKRFGEASADFIKFKQDLVNAINRSLSEQDAATLIARLEAFEAQYEKDKTTEQQAEEFMTELGAIMTSEDVELLKKSGLLNRVKELINNLLRKLGMDISLDTENEVVEFMNSLAKGVRGGVAVADIVGYDLGKEAKTLDELIDGEAGVAIGSTERTDFQESRKITIPKTDFTADIPQISLGEALEKYGVTEGDKRKRYAIITSDFTKVGYDSQGERVNGGVGFVSIEENVADGVGFASIEESTAKALFTRLRNNYGDNKNIAVLIMLQSPSSTIGNHYGAKYMYRALKALKSDIGESAYLDALDKSMTAKLYKDLKDSKVTKEQIFELFNQVDVLSQEDFVDNLIRKNKLNTSLNFRRGFGRTVLFPTIVTGKKKKKVERENPVAIELNRLGFNMDGFLDEYGQKEFMTQEMLDTDKSSYMVAGFQVNTRNEKDAESAVEQIQSGGILHGLFDGKVPAVKGTNFYLDGLYEVRKNFGIDFIEWRVDKIGSENRKKVDAYSRRKYKKPFTDLSQEKRDKVKEWGIPKGLFIEVKPEQSTRPSTIAQGIPAVSDRGVEIEPVMVEEAPLVESRRDEGVLAEGVDVSDSSNRKGLVPTEQLKEFIGEDRVGDAELPTSRRTIDSLKEDIKRNGFKEPIVVVYDKSSGDGEASILEGNHRMQAAIELGLKEVPVAFEKGTLRTDEQRVAEGMFPLNRKTVGQIDTRLGVDGTELGLDVRQPNEGDFKKPRVDEETFLQESRAIINEQFLSEEKQVAKFRKAGVDNKQTQQAINDIGLKGVKFTKEGIEEAIQKAFDDLSARAESFVMTEDSKAITGAIMADIEAMRADGASESQVAYAERGLEEGSPVRGEYIRKFQDAQRNEIRNWVSYLNQSDYNTSFKYLILDGVLTNNYDKKRNKYVKRDRKTLRSVTPFNAASLAELYQSDSKEMLKDYTDIQEKNAIALAKSRQVATTTEGEWIKYDGGDGVSNEDIANNASELAGLVSDTPWCTKTNAASQLRDGDFYVYATRGEDGSMIPRIAIRMEGNQVAEVRGVASEKQDLEPSMNPVAEKFLKENIPNDSGQQWLDSIEYNEKAEQLLQDINEKGLNRARMVSYFELLPDEKKYTQDYGRNGHIERLEAKIEELVKNNELARDLKGKVFISSLSETGLPLPNNTLRKANRENLGNAEFVIGELELKPPVSEYEGEGDSEFKVQYVSGDATVAGDVTNIKFVGGNLLVTDGNPISVEVVGGDVDINRDLRRMISAKEKGIDDVRTLGNLRKVGQNLSARNLKDLGNLEEVGDMLNISGSNIKSLGNKIKSVGYLKVMGKDASEAALRTDDAPLEDFGSLEKVERISLGANNLTKTIQPTENNIRFIENNREAFNDTIENKGRTGDPKYDSYYNRYQDIRQGIAKDAFDRGIREFTHVSLLMKKAIPPSDFYIQYLKDKAGEAPLQESRNFDRKTEKAMEGFAYDPKIDERINEKNKRSFTQQVKRGAMRFNWAWFDRQGDIRRKFIKAGDLISQAGLTTRYGSSASAKMLFDKFNKKIYGTLKGNKKKLLSEVIMLRRIISIYDGFDRSIEEFELEIKDLKAKKSLTKKEAVRLAEIESKLKEKKKQRDNFKNPRKLNRNSALARLDEIKQKLRDETGNDQQFFDIDNRATQFFSVMRNRLKKMLDEGLITQDEYFRLSKYEYSPRMFVDKVFDLESGDFKKHEKRFMSYGLSENEFKRLKEGSEEDLFVDGEFLLRMVLSSTESRILANRLYKGVAKNADKYDWVLVQPRKIDELNKEIEELQEKKDKTKDERKRLAEARKERASEIREFKKSLKGFSEVGYKEGGVRKELYIKDEMMEQMENPDEVLKSGRAMEMASYWLGAKFLRQMATGINVMFPLSNIPMDFRHIVMFTDVFDDNKSVGQSMLQLGGSFTKKIWRLSRIGKAVSGKDTKTEALLEEALEHGMGMDWLDMRTKVKFTGRLGTGIRKVGQTIFDNLQGFSEASEIAMRLAVYQKAKETALEKRKNGVGEFKDMSDTEIKMYAAHKGRTTIDFAQGGAYAKSWDKFSPYVNAKLQGGRVSFRYAVENKEKMAKKWAETSLYVGAFFGFLAQALFDWSDWDEEDKKAIPRWHILNYHILPLPDFISKVFFDDDHKHYLKIRKNPITAPFDRAAEHGGEYIYRKMKGDMTDAQIDKMHQDAKGDFITGVIDAAPFADLALGTDDEGNVELQLGVLNYMSPAIKAANQYRTNYDYFRDKTISYDKLYQPDISPELEGYNSEYVEDFYKEIGKAIGASPQRMKSSVEVITTSPSTNVLVGLTYGALNSIIGELDALSLKPMTDGAKNRMFGTANKDFLRSKPSKELSESLREYEENRFKVRKDLEKMVFRDKASVQEVKQYIGTIEDSKLVEYAENKYNKLKRKNEFHEVAIPNKSAYYTLDDYISENPELAAEYLFNEFGSLTNQELREVAGYISMIRGTRSFSYPPAFMRKYRELQK